MVCAGRVKQQRLRSKDGFDIAVFIEMDDGGSDVFLSGRVSPRLPESGARIRFRLSLTKEERWVAQNGEWLYDGTSVARPVRRRDGARVEGVVSTRKPRSDCCWITIGDLDGGVYCLAKWSPGGVTPVLGARVSFELKKGKYGDWRVASPPGLVVVSDTEILPDELPQVIGLHHPFADEFPYPTPYDDSPKFEAPPPPDDAQRLLEQHRRAVLVQHHLEEQMRQLQARHDVVRPRSLPMIHQEEVSLSSLSMTSPIRPEPIRPQPPTGPSLFAHHHLPPPKRDVSPRQEPQSPFQAVDQWDGLFSTSPNFALTGQEAVSRIVSQEIETSPEDAEVATLAVTPEPETPSKVVSEDEESEPTQKNTPRRLNNIVLATTKAGVARVENGRLSCSFCAITFAASDAISLTRHFLSRHTKEADPDATAKVKKAIDDWAKEGGLPKSPSNLPKSPSNLK